MKIGEVSRSIFELTGAMPAKNNPRDCLTRLRCTDWMQARQAGGLSPILRRRPVSRLHASL